MSECMSEWRFNAVSATKAIQMNILSWAQWINLIGTVIQSIIAVNLYKRSLKFLFNNIYIIYMQKQYHWSKQVILSIWQLILVH